MPKHLLGRLKTLEARGLKIPLSQDIAATDDHGWLGNPNLQLRVIINCIDNKSQLAVQEKNIHSFV
jgi:hypothetical protein